MRSCKSLLNPLSPPLPPTPTELNPGRVEWALVRSPSAEGIYIGNTPPQVHCTWHIFYVSACNKSRHVNLIKKLRRKEIWNPPVPGISVLRVIHTCVTESSRCDPEPVFVDV